MKKVIISLIVTVLVIVGIGLGVYFYKKHRINSNPVSCYPVEMLNEGGYYGYEGANNSSGIITEADDQRIYGSIGQNIKEIKVKEGDKVSVGDVIVTFDDTPKELELEEMKAQYEVYKDELTTAEKA